MLWTTSSVHVAIDFPDIGKETDTSQINVGADLWISAAYSAYWAAVDPTWIQLQWGQDVINIQQIKSKKLKDGSLNPQNFDEWNTMIMIVHHSSWKLDLLKLPLWVIKIPDPFINHYPSERISPEQELNFSWIVMIPKLIALLVRRQCSFDLANFRKVWRHPTVNTRICLLWE